MVPVLQEVVAGMEEGRVGCQSGPQTRRECRSDVFRLFSAGGQVLFLHVEAYADAVVVLAQLAYVFQGGVSGEGGQGLECSEEFL